MKADLLVMQGGFGYELRLEARTSYAQEFLTEELGLCGTGDTVKSMICSSARVAAEVLSRAIAEGLHVGLWQPGAGGL